MFLLWKICPDWDHHQTFRGSPWRPPDDKVIGLYIFNASTIPPSSHPQKLPRPSLGSSRLSEGSPCIFKKLARSGKSLKRFRKWSPFKLFSFFKHHPYLPSGHPDPPWSHRPAWTSLRPTTTPLSTGGLKAEKDKKNTPSPNPFFSQKISDSACNEP